MFFNLANQTGEKKELFGIRDEFVFNALKDYFEIQVPLQDQELFHQSNDQDQKLQILNKYCIAELNLEEEAHEKEN